MARSRRPDCTVAKCSAAPSDQNPSIVGADAARSAPWSRSLDWPIGDLTLAAITEEAERHISRLS